MTPVGHTPGPWRVVGRAPTPENVRFGYWDVEGKSNVASSCAYADANMIAAVPDMLATLDQYADTLCEGWCDKSSDCANFDDCGGCEARRVAGKARGETS